MLTGGRLKLTNGYEIAYTDNYNCDYNDWSGQEGFVVLDKAGQRIGGIYQHVADALEEALKYEEE